MASTRSAVIAAAALVLGAGACAEVLGLDDPAGRLGEGGTGATGNPGTGPGPTSTGTDGTTTTGQGGGPGVGGGSSTSTGSGSSTGGGGAGEEQVVVLPPDFAVHALGAAPEGAVLLLKNNESVVSSACESELPGNGLGAFGVNAAGCTFLGAITGPNSASFRGLDVAWRGSWVTVAGKSPAATVRLDGGAAAEVVANGGFSAWWAVASGSELIRATGDPVGNARVLPGGEEGGFFAFDSDGFGIVPATPSNCTTISPSGSSQVWGANLDADAVTCDRPRAGFGGTLLDAGVGAAPWALVRTADPYLDCMVIDVSSSADPNDLGNCDGSGRLFVHHAGDTDVPFVAALRPGLCVTGGSQGFGILRVSDDVTAVWCEVDGSPPATMVQPFRADDTHLWFVRQTAEGATIDRVDLLDDGSHAVRRELCVGCTIVDAVETAEGVYVAGIMGEEGMVLDLPVEGGHSFWASVPLSSL